MQLVEQLRGSLRNRARTKDSMALCFNRHKQGIATRRGIVSEVLADSFCFGEMTEALDFFVMAHLASAT